MSINNIFLRGIRLAVCGAMLFAVACTGEFETYNTNQHEATEDMMSHDFLKTGAFFSQMQRNVVLFQYGSGDEGTLSSDYQVAQGLTSDIYSGYIAPTGTWYNGVHNGSYSFIPGWINKTFESGFVDVMPAWQSVMEIAKQQELPEVAALATIIKVEAMHRVADAYGPIPYCNFGSGTLQNNYDGLNDVYTKFFVELDEAIDVLTAFVSGNPSATILEKYDIVYGGNAERWVKFANTLRLRLALRCVYADAALAKQEAEKSINNVYGVITTVNERAAVRRSINLSYYHPLYDIKDFNAGEARMGASMDAYMNGYNDPRRPAYFTAASDGGFHGVRLGIVGAMTGFVGPKISNLNIDMGTTEIVWITAAESYFLRAEGALRGWAMGGTARSFYENGISVSFEENGVSGAAAYTAGVTPPVAFVDNNAGATSSAAPSTVTVAWNENADFETNFERIITQKWIAMYPDGPEGWAEYRRTGYPKLFPVVNNNSGGTINTALQIRRIPYPQSEYNNNSAGVQTGIGKLNGGDNGGTKLWWDAKL
ncbi:RagB/SusD family nutrient uptake outer membrane protein [Dysgonomonas reticulitermitis]